MGENMFDTEETNAQDSAGQNPYRQNGAGQNLYGQSEAGQNPYGQSEAGQNPYGQSEAEPKSIWAERSRTGSI